MNLKISGLYIKFWISDFSGKLQNPHYNVSEFPNGNNDLELSEWPPFEKGLFFLVGS